MPIKPENKGRYPKNWAEISHFIIHERAKNKCEVCGVRNHAVGYRDEEGFFHGICGNIFLDLAGKGLKYPSLQLLPYVEARELADGLNDLDIEDETYIVIVLTTAHLDHTPENCDLDNLKAMCQKCHNNYDAPHRKQTRRATRNKGQMEIDFKL